MVECLALAKQFYLLANHINKVENFGKIFYQIILAYLN